MNAASFARAWRLRAFFLAACAALPPASAARAQGVAGEVLGVTIEPDERGTRLTLRCSAPMRPSWRREGARKIIVDLPGASTSSLPPELPVDANGIRSLRPRKLPGLLRLELDVERPLEVRLLSARNARDVVLELGEAPPERGRGSAPVAPPERGRGSAPATPPEPGRGSAPAAPPEPGRGSAPAARPEVGPPVPDILPGPSGPDLLPDPTPRAIAPGGQPTAPGSAPARGPERPASVPADSAGRLTGVELRAAGGGVRVRLRTTGPAEVKYGFIRGRTPRLFIDAVGVLLGDVADPTVPEGTPVVSVRVGQHSSKPPVTRVVLELKPGATAKDVAPAGREVAEVEVNGIVGPPQPAGPAPVTPRPPVSSRRLVIAIDAGHGGKDPGAQGARGLAEKRVTLDIALRLAEVLRARGYDIRLSRTGDSSLPPPRRSAWIRQTRSDLLISIHCDSVAGRPERQGTTTYFHQGHGASRSLAEQVQQSLVGKIRTPDMGVRSDYTRYDRGFYLLRLAARPAVLVETGYISNAATAALFATRGHRQKIAEGIAAGITDYVASSGLGSRRRTARAR